LKAGLALLGVHNLMMENRCLFKPLLVASGKPAFSSKSLLEMFSICWSPRGSNQREEEESVIYGWTEYVYSVEGMLYY